ncbi:uncharacterized protein OCT59_007027 [Rhizophagus irregularis]|uniref:uncharacterized protein n=1 Tax=Rhizophagus irregularis TaxID=588596 RepID=UPI00331A91DF|nr:hypothetical protein OCT59_007027 [Rhizophagus irregularis]
MITNFIVFEQSQILALNEAIRQEKASSSIDCNNPVTISPDYATSTSIPPTPIRASKPSNRWTSAEIRILIKEVGAAGRACRPIYFNLGPKNDSFRNKHSGPSLLLK